MVRRPRRGFWNRRNDRGLRDPSTVCAPMAAEAAAEVAGLRTRDRTQACFLIQPELRRLWREDRPPGDDPEADEHHAERNEPEDPEELRARLVALVYTEEASDH